MIFMIVVTLLCAFGIGVMGYLVYLLFKEVRWVNTESRNSTSELPPHRRDVNGG